MDQNWKLNVWGVRGSMPTAACGFLTYGGNTSCFSVDCGEDVVIFDAGSGLTDLGRRLDVHRPVHLFIGHVHMDHILGLFIFPLFYRPGARIHIYGEARNGVPFREQLETVVGPPYWPVGFPDFQAEITFHEIGPGQTIPLPGGRTVRTMRGSHPNQSLLCRLDGAGKSVAYTLDCELTDALRPSLVEFCRGAGVLIWDANFTTQDLSNHLGWGHSSWTQGIALARDAGAGLLLLAHYNQTYTDAFLWQWEQLGREPGVRFAREGMEVLL